MPGMRCAVAVCSNSRVKTLKSGNNLSFYRFPKNKELRQIWIQQCKRHGKWNYENTRVCADHFSKEDFERDLQAELLGQPVKSRLKSTAIPTLKLSTSTSADPGKKFIRPRKKLVEDILDNAEENNVNIPYVSLSVSSPVTPSVPVATASSSQGTSEERYNLLLENYNKLLSEHKDLQRQCSDMQSQADKLKEKIDMLEKDLKCLSSSLMLEKSYQKTIENS